MEAVIVKEIIQEPWYNLEVTDIPGILNNNNSLTISIQDESWQATSYPSWQCLRNDYAKSSITKKWKEG